MTGLFPVAGKTALVTGGGRGIGLMIARGLVGAGVRVYLAARRADACEKAAAELSQLGECAALPADLADGDECARLAAALGEREDRRHLLVNNAASKAAVHHLTKVLAKRLARDGITVNAVAPGPFVTDMMASTAEAHGADIAAAAPPGRLGEPDDLVGAVRYLASRSGSYLTGVVLPVDGGLATTL